MSDDLEVLALSLVGALMATGRVTVYFAAVLSILLGWTSHRASRYHRAIRFLNALVRLLAR